MGRLIVVFLFCSYFFLTNSSGALAQRDSNRIEIAKKEGEVILYSNLALDRGGALLGGFTKVYPNMKVKHLRANAPQLANRVMTERKAGKLQMDVLLISFFFLDPIIEAGAVESYCSRERDAFPLEFKDKNCIWTLLNANTHVIAYNTKLVPKPEAPKNYHDLLNPKWQGKMVMEDGNGR